MRFSRRTDDTMESFIMKLIAVANRPGMISFASGLPDKRLFDIEGLKKAAVEVMESSDAEIALQYGVTEGFLPLREKIAERCRKEMNVDAKAENIFITNGSQECFDHLGKMFLDPGDGLVVENPGYLGALQSFSVYAPKFYGIDLNENGPDMEQLTDALRQRPKMFYSIPNYQNPSGMSYSEDSRKEVAELFTENDTVLMEDDAYGELGFDGKRKTSIRSLNDQVILSGSFSKIISPGMRVGWMIVPDDMVEQTRTSLEAACLHANAFSQCVMNRFLEKHDLTEYLGPIRKEYRRKRDLMLDLLEDGNMRGSEWNVPEGGMFIWFRTPKDTDAMRLYEEALKKKVVIMPGKPFHIRGGENTIRLNYATASDEELKEGIGKLVSAFKDLWN